jgi:hypothetical protein
MKKNLIAIISVLFIVGMSSSVRSQFAFVWNDGEWGYSQVDGGEISIIQYLGNEKDIVLPSQVEGVGPIRGITVRVFSDNSTLESVVIPENIYVINQGAFSNCKNLKKVVLPKSLKKINEYVFFGCESLEEINFEEGLELIGEGAFMGCRELGDFVFPRSLNFLGRNAFGFCSSLRNAYFKGNAPSVPTLSDFPIEAPGWSWGSPSMVFPGCVLMIFYLEGTIGWDDPLAGWMNDNLYYFFLRPWKLDSSQPEVFVSQRTVKDGKVEMTLVFGGALQSSTNLKDWEPVETASPYLVSVPTADKKFYRAVSSE